MTGLHLALVGSTATVAANITQRHDSVDSLLQAATTADAVLLNLPAAAIDQALQALRRDERYQFSLVYLLEQHDGHQLADGLLPDSMQTIAAQHEQLLGRLKAFNRGQAPGNLEERVMAWLWTRRERRVEPCRLAGSHGVYSYPLISALAADEQVDQYLWLRLNEENGLLAPLELVDRIRLCTECNSARLNYVDVCPGCKSLDIARQPALHCFTCGHVGPQEHFLKDGLLLCPNCMSKLRHIGSDYDRPLENQSCRSCRTSFMDAQVQARCLDCNHSHTPGDLRVREVRAYQMTERGRLRCRQGFGEELRGDYFGRLKLIGLRDFARLLDWQIQQVRRYRDIPACTLLALRFDDAEKLLDSLEGQTLLDNLMERIRDVIRETDRCTRTRENLLWMLLPHTDREGAALLGKRLSAIVELLEKNYNGATVTMGMLTIPDELEAEETARLVMARLEGLLADG